MLSGEAKKEYQRAYMRRRRAAIRADKIAADPATAIADWCKENLVIPTGLKAGQPFELAEFQRQWLSGALRDDAKESFLSLPRKNGKSSLIAAALLSFLVGPLNRKNWHCAVVSLTGPLALELRRNVQLIADASGLDDVDIRATPPPGMIFGRNGAYVTILAASEASGHAISTDLIVIDEAGLLKEKSRELWDNMLQSVSAKNGRLWAISIRADGAMFAELVKRNGEQGVFGLEYKANDDCDIQDESAWKQANPGLELGIKSMDYMRHMANRAAENAAYQPNFMAKDLNLPMDPARHMIVTTGAYQQCVVDELPPTDGPCFCGIDLGSSTSMSGASFYWPLTHRLEVFGAWPAEPDLLKRGKQDSKGQLYVQMHQRGELSLYPGVILDVQEFIREVKIRLKGHRVLAAGADRHRYREITLAFQANRIRWPIEWRHGQSAKADNAADVRSFQAAVLGGLIKTKRNLVLESAIKQSSVIYDSLGNPSLDKSNALSRIDALSAAVIAVGLGDRWRQANRKKKTIYHGIVR